MFPDLVSPTIDTHSVSINPRPSYKPTCSIWGTTSYGCQLHQNLEHFRCSRRMTGAVERELLSSALVLYEVRVPGTERLNCGCLWHRDHRDITQPLWVKFERPRPQTDSLCLRIDHPLCPNFHSHSCNRYGITTGHPGHSRCQNWLHFAWHIFDS